MLPINEALLGIARSLHEAGARLIFTYVGDRLAESVKELASTLERDDSIILPCDVTSDEEIEKCFATIKEKYKSSMVLHMRLHLRTKKSLSVNI